MGLKITIMSGAEDGKIYLSDKTPITIGRHPDDDVYLPFDLRISRHHARITKENSSYCIEDTGIEGTGSINGTYIGLKKISGKTALSSGQIISIGAVLIKLEQAVTL
jgi:pSer/pThr/pTyr-binding forkhead associated (FHA) protein